MVKLSPESREVLGNHADSIIDNANKIMDIVNKRSDEIPETILPIILELKNALVSTGMALVRIKKDKE